MPLPFVSLLQDLEAACAHLYVRLALHDVDTYNTHRNWAFHPVSLLECLSLLHPCCRTWKQLALTCTLYVRLALHDVDTYNTLRNRALHPCVPP